jgi:aspartate racemase
MYDELCSGQIKDSSRINYLKIIKKLSEQGAQAVILGCTEIALLVQQHHTQVKLYDTTEIHCDAAVQLALKIND